MSLSCYCGDGDYDWWHDMGSMEFEPMDKKRASRCLSCNKPVQPGEEAMRVRRFRATETDIEERIYGDEVPLACKWLCEGCGGLAIRLDELGFCFELGTESLAEQIAEYNDAAGIPVMSRATT